METTAFINLDFQRLTYNRIRAKQNDTWRRRVNIEFFSNGNEQPLTDVATFVVQYKKKDGTKGFYTHLPDGSVACTFSGNTLYLTMAPQMLTVAGEVSCSVAFLDENSQMLQSFSFFVDVEESENAGATSDDYLNAPTLQNILNLLEQFNENFDRRLLPVEFLSNQIPNVVADSFSSTNLKSYSDGVGDLHLELIEGSYLLASNGESAIISDSAHSFVPVKPGSVYLFSGYLPSNGGLIFYDKLKNYLGYDRAGVDIGGGNVVRVDYEFTIPNDCFILGVCTRNKTTHPIVLKLVKENAVLDDLNDQLNSTKLEVQNVQTHVTGRLNTIENELFATYTLKLQPTDTGCYLKASDGQPTNKTDILTDAEYVIASVSAGQKYRISCYLPSDGGVIFYDQNSTYLGYDRGGKEIGAGNVLFENQSVIIPDGCSFLGVCTRNKISHPIQLNRIKPMEQSVPDQLDNNNDRLFALENRMGFSFRNVPKGQIILMTDGTRDILLEVYEKIKSHGAVLSVAPVVNSVLNVPIMGAGTEREIPTLDWLHRVEQDGGEIFAHSMNGEALDEMTVQDAEAMMRESKHWLQQNGFTINGWIAPKGRYNEGAERFYRKYFRYAYKGGPDGEPMNFKRPYLSELGLDGAKTLIDQVESSKAVQILFHHWSDDEIEGFDLNDLDDLLMYAKQKDIEFTTYRDCFYKYGTNIDRLELENIVLEILQKHGIFN